MRYEFSEHASRAGWYSVLDKKTGIRIDFEAHRINETQEIDIGDFPVDAAAIATALREIGDWISFHHYSDAMPVPTYEYRLSEDNEVAMVIRHKQPCFTIVSDAKIDTSSTAFTNAVKKAAEFLKKVRQQ